MTQNGADIVSFNKKTGQVSLWDNKALKDAEMIQGSKTFNEGPRKQRALAQANEAVQESALSRADKDLALKAIKTGNVRFVTAGSGAAKNSVVQ